MAYLAGIYPRFVPYNGKIADITHADTNKHTLDLAAALSETRTIIAVLVSNIRQAGSGVLQFYPNEGANILYLGSPYQERPILYFVAAGTNRVQYDLTVKNDDFDLFCYGYVVED